MPATTPNGLPYPLGTDRVMDGDDAIKALATALRITQGNIPIPDGPSQVTVAVTFPAGLFLVAPCVVATASSASALTGAGGATVNGFNLSVQYRTSSGAVGPVSGIAARYVAVAVGGGA